MKFFAYTLAALAVAVPALAQDKAAPAAAPAAGGTKSGGLPNGGTLDLSGLSQCALPLVIKAVTDAGCSSPLDTDCVCTDKFLGAATKTILGGCPGKDAVGALGTMKALCPNLPLPDLSKLPECALNQVIDTLKKQNCNGPNDKECICDPSFALNAVAGFFTQCELEGLGDAVTLLLNICRPAHQQGCAATGIWKITDFKCILGGPNKDQGSQGGDQGQQGGDQNQGDNKGGDQKKEGDKAQGAAPSASPSPKKEGDKKEQGKRDVRAAMLARSVRRN